MEPVPAELQHRPFRLDEAQRHGLSRRVLQAKRFVRVHRQVYACADLELTLRTRIVAALLVMPADAAAASITALQLYGVDVGPCVPLHLSTRHPHQARLPNVVLHRHTWAPTRRRWDGLPVCCPEQAWVRAGLRLTFVERVVAGDWLLHLGRTSLPALQAYADSSHEHGVKRARRALAYVRERVESPRETVLRLMLRFARLPEPHPNVPLGNSTRFLARVDLIYLAYRVIVEYDGDHHRIDRRQRERDIERREALEREGWRVIVVTAQSMRHPQQVVRRVHRALVEGGYRGPAPVFSDVWNHWFAAA